jgi:3-oxoacyl-[acyl-carrier protein] reductase
MKKIAIITGASQGIGRAIALELDRNGVIVVLTGRDSRKLHNALEDFSSSAVVINNDVRNEDEVVSMVRKVIEKYERIDILVNNAGIMKRSNLADSTKEKIDDIIDTNLKGVIYCTREVTKYMKKQKRGQIINISSTIGKRGDSGRSIYSASKFALAGFGESIHNELKEYGIKVATLYLGLVATEGVIARSSRTKVEIGNALKENDIAYIVLAIVNQSQSSNIKEVIIESMYTC